MKEIIIEIVKGFFVPPFIVASIAVFSWLLNGSSDSTPIATFGGMAIWIPIAFIFFAVVFK